MRVAFAMCDRDADGLISIQEVYDTMTSLGHKVSHRQVKQIIRRVDTDRMHFHCRCRFDLRVRTFTVGCALYTYLLSLFN